MFGQPTPEDLARYQREQRAAQRLSFAIMIAAPLLMRELMREDGKKPDEIARESLHLAEELIAANEAMEANATNLANQVGRAS